MYCLCYRLKKSIKFVKIKFVGVGGGGWGGRNVLKPESVGNTYATKLCKVVTTIKMIMIILGCNGFSSIVQIVTLRTT